MVTICDVLSSAPFGSVAEWSIAPVLKTGNPQGFVSSNLTASATRSGRMPVNAQRNERNSLSP